MLYLAFSVLRRKDKVLDRVVLRRASHFLNQRWLFGWLTTFPAVRPLVCVVVQVLLLAAVSFDSSALHLR